MILGSHTPTLRGEAGEAAASLKKASPEEYVDQSLDVIEWAVALVPRDPIDVLLGYAWRRVRPDRRQYLRKPPQPYRSEPTVDLDYHESSPSR
jgi:hypothetical protein